MTVTKGTPHTVVISQPMFLPWIGVFEQIALADTYIHYTDVQFPQGRSFMYRVQLKDGCKQRWLTAPINRKNSKGMINEIHFGSDTAWRRKHLNTIHHLYSKAPFYEEMFAVIEDIYQSKSNNLSQFNIYAIETIAKWFGLNTTFELSSDLMVTTSSSQRLLDLCLIKNAKIYVTGHGALRYLDHAIFEERGINVRYMNYINRPYSQLRDGFLPYVSIIDLMANEGMAGAANMCSQAVIRDELPSELFGA